MTAHTSSTKRLSTKTIEHFRQEGYALPGLQLLPPEELEALTNTFEDIQAQWVAQGGQPEHMDVPHFYFPELHRFLFNDDVLDVVQDLIGPDIALFSSHFISKPAGNGKRVPWHEDSAYWKGNFSCPENPDSDGMDVVTIWLAIDPSHPENSNMKVIPRSHLNGYSEYEDVKDPNASVFNTNIKSDQFDESTAVDCTLKKGEFSLHHAKTIHGSDKNTSDMRRCGYTMRFISTRSKFHPENTWGKLPHLYLARGVDHAGNTYLEKGHAFQDWVDKFGSYIPKGH
jgi:hypothetical protein